MEQSQQEQRHTAAKEFQQSLDELQDILHNNTDEEEDTPELHNDITDNETVGEDLSGIDLAAWDDAVADIEQYLQAKEKADS